MRALIGESFQKHLHLLLVLLLLPQQNQQCRIWVDCVLVCRPILNDGDVRDRNSGLVRDYGRVRYDSLVRDYGRVRDAPFVGVPWTFLSVVSSSD